MGVAENIVELRGYRPAQQLPFGLHAPSPDASARVFVTKLQNISSKIKASSIAFKVHSACDRRHQWLQHIIDEGCFVWPSVELQAKLNRVFLANQISHEDLNVRLLRSLSEY